MRIRAAVAVLLVAATLGLTGESAGARPQRTGRVVVVAVPDLRWDDVSRRGTPALWELADRGSIGALSIRTFGFATSCAGGLLSLGAGSRATASAYDEDRPCGAALEPLLSPPVWQDVRAINRRTGFRARPGAMGDALRAAGRPTIASGDAGAGLVLGERGAGIAPAGGTGVEVLTLSSLYGVSPAQRARALAEIDADIGVVAGALDRGADDLLIAGISDQPHGQPHLHVAIATGRAFRPGLLRSASTGRTPFTQLIDVAPTVLAGEGVKRPAAMVGQPWFTGGPRRAGLAETIDHFVDLDHAARVSGVTGRSFQRVYAAALVLFFLAGSFLLALGTRRSRARRALATLAPAIAVLPVATFLAQAVPWWRNGGGVLYGLVIATCAAAVAVALVAAKRWGTSAAIGVVAGASAALLVGDMLTGGRLQISALFGDSPLIAGRFHGAGNVDFALIGTTTLLSAGSAAYLLRSRGRPHLAVAAAVAIAVIGVVVDGAPPFGDDLGGSLALAPAALVLLIIASGRVLSWTRVVIAGVLAIVPAALFAAYDYSLSADRQSHVGRFVGQVLHGGAFTVVRRKAVANLHQLQRPALLLPLLAAIACTAVLLSGRGERPAPLVAACRARRELAGGFAAVLVCAVLGGLLNDSGAAIPVSAAAVGLSLAILLCAREAVPA